MFVRTGRQRGQGSGRAAIVALAVGIVGACGPGKPSDTDGDDATGDTGPDGDTGTSTTTTGPTTDPMTDPTTTAPTTTIDPDPTDTGGPDEALTCVPGRTPQRRLTHLQYFNTLADLLPGVKLPPIELLPTGGPFQGFDNIADFLNPWDFVAESYAVAAASVAAAAAEQGGSFLPCAPDGGADPAACGAMFIDAFAPRALRRPVSADEKAALDATFTAALAADGFQAAIAATIASLLGSQRFVDLVEGAGEPVAGHPEVLALTGFEVASRLSYFLWNTMPDPELFAAAQDGTLATRAGVEAQARRLLMSPRARAMVARYALHWLYLHRLEEGTDTPEGTPMEIQASLRGEIERLVGHVVFDGEGTLASLLTTNIGFVNADLAMIYDVVAPGQDLALTELDPQRRPGLLTRAGWLTMRNFNGHHSPFQRGWRLLDSLLCFDMPPVPPGVDVLLEFPGDMTTREVYQAALSEPECQGCHSPAHDIGYGLENFDFLGVWRDQENGLPIDASSDWPDLWEDGQGGPFDGPAGLTAKLAASEATHDCATRKAYTYALGRVIGDADVCDLEALQAGFLASGGDLHELLVQITISDGFRHLLAP